MKMPRFFFIAILLQIGLFFAISAATLSNSKKQSVKILFKENNGHVYDQNHQSRTDVLFSATAGKMVCHFKNPGVSYQQIQVNSWKKIEKQNPKTSINQKIKTATFFNTELKYGTLNEKPGNSLY